ncbi:hypothetical protein AOCH_000051 [Aspergillus ochraceoroseus]|uniref:Trehalase n=1 Tax=Aspergillus ochraceoroseus TaxID=138278 RepID=A0A0F8TYF2_9EURO|nr:hypothetical protein AOCH_000051 [Aspergillus ochraceoroseus]
MSTRRMLPERLKTISTPTNLTDGPDTPWTAIGPGKEHLAQELEKLYWEGARQELENILRTLRIWQRPEYAGVALEEDKNETIQGYDNFLDQVNQQARAFAIRYREEMGKFEGNTTGRDSDDVVRVVALDAIAEHSSAKVKAEVRRNLTTIPKLSGSHHLAWMLMQTAGFLDIDMLIEHRSMWDKSEKRPGIPQLRVRSSSKEPEFQSLKCRKCKNPITSSIFASSHDPDHSSICEQCYWLHHYGDNSYSKIYKHAVVADSLAKVTSCNCKESVPSSSGVVINERRHWNLESGHSCHIAQIQHRIAQAKYDAVLTTIGKTPPKQSLSSVSRMLSRLKRQSKSETTSVGDRKVSSELSLDVSVARCMADEDVPLFFRQCVEKNPFGYMHTALRVGTVVIENGVSKTHAGALISLRDPPVYHERFPGRVADPIRPRRHALCIGTDSARVLWEHKRPIETPRHHKFMMKQIVGAPFSGILSEKSLEGKLELEIIKLLVVASGEVSDDPKFTVAMQQKKLAEVLDPIFNRLKGLLATRVKVYLNSITQQLLDPDMPVTWNPIRNNCLSFCSSLLDPAIFEPLVNGPSHAIPGVASPLYLMSFLCATIQEYPKHRVMSKFDVPHSHTEEYLHRFYFGRHKDSDIIDVLQEYWYDWGAFRDGPLYEYQKVFPWDCSEAYKRCPIQCGECSIAKHVWAFPFDAWSMIALHLQRDEHLYPKPLFQDGSGNNTQVEWVKSRYHILTASSVLNRVATAMAQSPRFCKTTAWLHHSHKGLRRIDPSLTRAKLGGIHRAQPFSHYFEAGTSDYFFIAQWAMMERQEQREYYETFRNARMQLTGVPRQISLNPKFTTTTEKSKSLVYSRFRGRREEDHATTRSADNYYPYYFATLDPNFNSDYQCADGQFHNVDNSAGDDDASKGSGVEEAIAAMWAATVGAVARLAGAAAVEEAVPLVVEGAAEEAAEEVVVVAVVADHDEENILPFTFKINVKQTLERLLAQEDTNNDSQITTQDKGPKAMALGTTNSDSVRTRQLRGTYQLANLLETLYLIREKRGLEFVSWSAITENPVDRIPRTGRRPHALVSTSRRISDLAIRLYKATKSERDAVDFLRTAILAAIKEYRQVWTSEPRYDPVSGLSRYGPPALGVPPQGEEGHFDWVLLPYGEKHGITVPEFIQQYNEVRESGHDTSHRFESGAAYLATVDLNCLLYKYETDIAYALEHILDNSLTVAGPWCSPATQQQSPYEYVTTLYALWSGIATPAQAASLVPKGLARFECVGGLSCCTASSRGPITASRPQRQWDYPFGWAPHQMLAWRGLQRYGYTEEMERLVYRWLQIITQVAMDLNSAITEKYDVTQLDNPARADSEYGNQGLAFKGANLEGFGWTNASFSYGLNLIRHNRVMINGLNLRVPYDQLKLKR